MAHGVEWGDVATWVTAVGTTGALTLALSLALLQRRQARVSDERHQAALVSAWLELVEDPAVWRVRLVVRNGSPSQVNDFHGEVRDMADAERPPADVWISGVPPTGQPIIRILPIPPPDSRHQYRYELIYEYTDVYNRRWRHARGCGLRIVKRDAQAVKYKLDGTPQ